MAAVPAIADPSHVQQKQAEAQAVLTQIHAMDADVGAAVERWNLANVKLEKIRKALKENAVELKVAKGNLKVGQQRIAQRVVALYTSGGSGGTLEVILGAQSLDDLITRLDTASRVTSLDARVLHEVRVFKESTKRHKKLLAEARVAQVRVVAERMAQKQAIEGQLAQRKQLLASIKSEIAQLQAAEAARQASLDRAAQARVAAAQAAQQASVDPNPAVGISADAGAGAAPPSSQYGGVVGVAMRHLGTPYVWGGGSPGGFDCSGLISYAYGQLGVSLPHSTYALWAMGSSVSKDQLEPGDVVFFDGLGHAGIYIGGGQFVHAPHTGDVVKVSSLGDSWYASTYVGARRY